MQKYEFISNLFLTSLAAADFLVGLVIDPVWIVIRFLGYHSNKTYIETFGRSIDYHGSTLLWQQHLTYAVLAWKGI